jgi:hypothetical protein
LSTDLTDLACAAGDFDVDFFVSAPIEYQYAMMVIVSLFPDDFDMEGFIAGFVHEVADGPYQLRYMAISFLQSIDNMVLSGVGFEMLCQFVSEEVVRTESKDQVEQSS